MSMHRIAAAWLVLELTHSPVYVAAVFALNMAPSVLLGPFSGALADRMSRKWLLAGVHVFAAVTAITTGLLVLADVMNLPLALGLVALFGAGLSLAFTVIQTLTYDIVGRRNVLNGLSLNALGTRMIGAAGALGGGLLIEAAGIGPTFVAAGCAAAAGLLAIAFIRTAAGPRQRGGSVLDNVVAGIRLMLGSNIIATLLVMALAMEAFGFGMQALLPVFASDAVFNVGARGLGIMMACFRLGGVAAAVALAATGELRRRGLVMLGLLALSSLFIAGFSQAPAFPLALVLLAFLGAVLSSYDTLQNVVLQQSVPEEMRGRAVGAQFVIFGLGPLGPMALGALGLVVGVQVAVGLGAAVTLATALSVAVVATRLRALD